MQCLISFVLVQSSCNEREAIENKEMKNLAHSGIRTYNIEIHTQTRFWLR